MAFEITVPEALAILGVTRAELKLLIEVGELKEVVSRGPGNKVRRFLRRQEVVALARRIEQRTPAPPRKRGPSRRKPAVGPELLSVTIAARLLDVSLPTCHALVDDGQLPVARTSRKGFLNVRREDVIALIETRRASRCRLPSKGGRASRDELVDVPAAALLLNTTPVRVYGLINDGTLQVAHVSADGARCLRRKEVRTLAGLLAED